jgi:hypothetical protein
VGDVLTFTHLQTHGNYVVVVPYPNNDRNSISKRNEEMTLWFVLNFLVSGSGIAKNTHGRARYPSVGCIRTNSSLLLAES